MKKRLQTAQSKQKQSAFTLIELLIAVAVMGIIANGMLGFLGNFLQLKFNAEAKLRIREEGTYALDRIEYLIRNSLTVPDICGYSNNTNVWLGKYQTIKFNLPEDRYRVPTTQLNRIHRMRVKYFPSTNELVEFATYPDGCTHSSCESSFNTATNGVNLTKMNPGSTSEASQRFKVTEFYVRCMNDQTFLMNYVVHIHMKIEYQRRSVSSNYKTLEENFDRYVDVRNPDPWRN